MFHAYRRRLFRCAVAVLLGIACASMLLFPVQAAGSFDQSGQEAGQTFRVVLSLPGGGHVVGQAVRIPAQAFYAAQQRPSAAYQNSFHGLSPSRQPVSTQSAVGSTSEEEAALDLLNSDRRQNGLSPLRLNGNLRILAERYAQDMIARHYFAHNNPEGQSPFDRMKQAGIAYRYAGENLALNTDISTAERAFMNSPGHRANILSPHYVEAGVGVVHDQAGSVYVVQEFIGP